MQHIGITCFTMTLFIALAARTEWRRRRVVTAARLNRVLRGYVTAECMDRLSDREETRGEDLIPA